MLKLQNRRILNGKRRLRQTGARITLGIPMRILALGPTSASDRTAECNIARLPFYSASIRDVAPMKCFLLRHRNALSLPARVLALVLVVAAAATPAGAQSTTSATLYRLEAGSSFSRGCYGPCLCPIFTTKDIRGTYTLALDHVDPLFTWSRVEKVNWVVALGGVDTRVTGSGTYRVGGEVALQQQMKLTLTIGDEAAQTFDSGLVSGGGSFPEIDIAMSMNGMSCFDTVIDIRSRPVSTPYALSASTYDEGCFAPCLCPIREWPVTGSAELVPLPNA